MPDETLDVGHSVLVTFMVLLCPLKGQLCGGCSTRNKRVFKGLSHYMRLGPARSSFVRLSCGFYVRASEGDVDRSVLDLTKCGDCASRQSHSFLLALGPRLAFIKLC